ncbi:MAG: LysE family transporter [Deferrisomatales bacterium]|nr:LysE family transporter [Deferrisomatales bacterium]
MMAALAQGFLFGWVGSMPIVGAVSVFVCQRGLAGQLRNGLALASGAALAEGAWCLVVLQGVGQLFTRWPAAATVAKALGGVLLVCVGVYFLTRHTTLRNQGAPVGAPARRLRDEFLLGATLVGVNLAIPVNWLAAVTVAVSIGLVPTVPPPTFALGVTFGVVAWFALLLRLLVGFRRRLSASVLDRVLHILGMLLIGGGFVALWMAWT